MIEGFSKENIGLAWGLLGLTWVLRNTDVAPSRGKTFGKRLASRNTLAQAVAARYRADSLRKRTGS
jgi:hypothetical protein